MRRLALASVVLLAVCGSADAATRGFAVGGFDRVRSSGAFDVRVHTGAAPSAHATGDQAQLDRLIVEVRDGELQISNKPGAAWNWSWGSRKAVVVEVTVPMVRAATLAGSGSVAIDHVRTRAFEGTLTGSGDLNLPAIEAEEVALTLTGSGDLTAAGRAGRSTIVQRGSGDLRSAGLMAQDARVELTGSGDLAAGATRTADVRLTGSGDIRVTGPARCTIAKHGSGNVRCG